MFPYKALRLNDKVSLIMPEREPQRFLSDVTVYTRQGDVRNDTIEVNHPLKVAGWNIYQLSYDETKGRWSDVSVFELVYDPWLPYVYTGIIMMMLGAVCLFVNAQKREREDFGEKKISSDEKKYHRMIAGRKQERGIGYELGLLCVLCRCCSTFVGCRCIRRIARKTSGVGICFYSDRTGSFLGL